MIQIYVLDGTMMRKIGLPVTSFNDANLIVGLYPGMLRSLGLLKPAAEFTWFAIRDSELFVRQFDGVWTEVA